MKKIAIALASLLALTVSAFAKAPTPVVVDVGELLRGYYKTADADLRLKSAQQTAEAELNKQAEPMRKIEAQLAEMMESLKNPALTEEGRKKIEADAQPLIQQFNAMRQQIGEASQKASQELQQRKAVVQEGLMKDIREKTVEVAKQKNADMVLTLNAGVLWADSAYDITKDVLEALNAGQTKK